MVKEGRPVRVTTGRRGVGSGSVKVSAGPWRTSGEWWTTGEPGGDATRFQEQGGGRLSPSSAWNRDEWDVELADGAVYRIFRDRSRDGWFVEGIVD
jgi:protein ImuB